MSDIPPLRHRFPDDPRSPEQIWEHYQLERRLADRLRASTKEERKTLYGEAYTTLYASLPHHPRHHRRASADAMRSHVESQMRMLRPFLGKAKTLLEIGSGDGSLTSAAAQLCKRVVGLDVSVSTIAAGARPSNVLYVQYDGNLFPSAEGSIDVAYSNAVMEHLHVDDAFDQLKSICRSLAADGVYVFYTPHRFMGPGDVSKYFDTEAKGFHLKEYTYRELRDLLRQAGFTRAYGLVWFKGRHRLVPIALMGMFEAVLGLLPYELRHKVSWNRFVTRLVQIKIAAFR